MSDFNQEEENLSESKVRETKIYEQYQTDSEFFNFVNKNFGDFEGYLEAMESGAASSSNMTEEIIAPVKIVETAEDGISQKVSTTDHISVMGIINQLQLGVCAITTQKVNGDVKTFMATLHEDFVPESKWKQREGFFGPLSHNRIGFWDTIKQSWGSFYPEYMASLVRNETSTIE